MANEEVLGSRKAMIVLVIVVGCFAVLWPRILSPLLLGTTREQLQPNQFDREAALKQERPSTRGVGPHPALRERGRAIPTTPPPSPRSQPLPPHVRVRSSPLDVYFELDIKPPPIPGMRPPLGSAGGPVPAPKSSMGFVMPIYTICICVFFVYTLSKLLFKRVGTTPYEPVGPDPQFRKRVFRDDSRTSPEKLVVTAISGLVAEVHQQMEASYAQNQQTQDVQDNHTRPYTNGTLIHTGPVQIVASEYREPSKEKTTFRENEPSRVVKEPSPELKESSQEPKEPRPESREPSPVVNSVEYKDKKVGEESLEVNEQTPVIREDSPQERELTPEHKTPRTPEPSPEVELPEKDEVNHKHSNNLLESNEKEAVGKSSNDFLSEETESFRVVSTPELEISKNEMKSTPELLEEALKEDSPVEEDEEIENGSVKVLGMELRAQAEGGPTLQPRPAPEPAAEVKSIYLDTEIPQQSRVLVADFEDSAESKERKHAPSVVSGKMTLSLIQDAPSDTPERDLESTFDDFTTASALTQPAAKKEDDPSDEEVEEDMEVEEEMEVEEDIEVEEIEEEVEVEEDEEEDESPVKIEEMN